MTVKCFSLLFAWLVAGVLSTQTPPTAPGAGANEPTPAAKAPGAGQGLRIVQEVKGIPGRPDGEFTRQEVELVSDRLRVFDEFSEHYFLVRLDQTPVGFYDISKNGLEYTRGQDYEKVQRDRDEFERNLRHNAMMDPAEKKLALEQNAIREDGRRVVKVDLQPAEPVRIGGRELSVKQLEVTENGRRIVKGLITEDLGREIPLFQFYRRLGAFSDEVLAALEKVPGVPISVEFLVVTGATLNVPMVARVVEVEETEFPLDRFELDPEAKELVESPFVRCELCGLQVEKAASRGTHAVQGRLVYFCCKDHWEKFKEKGKRPDRPDRQKARKGDRRPR